MIGYGILLLQSGILNNYTDYDIHRDYYLNEFLYNGTNIIKIITVMYSMLVCIYGFYISKYDVFLIGRFCRNKTIISKVSVVLWINSLFLLSLSIFYLCLWVVIDNSISVNIIYIFTFKMMLFVMYYTVLFAILIIIFENLFIIILPFVGYLVSNFSIDYGLEVQHVSSTSKLLNTIFPDLIVLNKGFEYVYGWVYVLSMFVLFTGLLFYQYKHNDLVI